MEHFWNNIHRYATAQEAIDVGFEILKESFERNLERQLSSSEQAQVRALIINQYHYMKQPRPV